MSVSFFLAQVLGCYVFFMSLAMLVHHQAFKRIMHEFITSQPMVVFSGGVGLLFGLLIVISHNVWVAAWPVLITLIGWFLLIQALIRIFFPMHFAKVCKDLMAGHGYTIMCWVWLVISLFLIWAGFSLMY